MIVRFPENQTNCLQQIIASTHINLVDLVKDRLSGDKAKVFESLEALRSYTLGNRKKIYPKDAIPKGSPLARLLAHILYPHLESGGGRRRR